MHPEARNRLRIIAGIVLAFGALFLVRLYYLQIIHGEDFTAEAEKQYVATLPNLFARGNIYFTEKGGRKVAAATINSGFVVSIIPKEITDKEGAYTRLNAIIPLVREEFMIKAQKEDDPYEEGDLVLTIEPTVQSYFEKEIQSVMDEWHSDQTGGIIMDPKTGAIYAMAVNPSFDLNDYGSAKNARIYSNPIIQNDYEMGSIVKPLTVAAGIDAGVISANTTYNDVGHITLNRKKLANK